MQGHAVSTPISETPTLKAAGTPRHFASRVACTPGRAAWLRVVEPVLRDAPRADLALAIDRMGVRLPVARGSEIFGQGEEAMYLYRVIRGAVRTCETLDDGRRQIVGFHLPGEIFGLDVGARHQLSAEAVSDGVVIAVKRASLFDRLAGDGALVQELLILAGHELETARAHAKRLLLTAQERVSDFLAEIERRQGGRGRVELPMSRQDIADHLGLTIETVSRTFTHLADCGEIELEGIRRVALRRTRATRECGS